MSNMINKTTNILNSILRLLVVTGLILCMALLVSLSAKAEGKNSKNKVLSYPKTENVQKYGNYEYVILDKNNKTASLIKVHKYGKKLVIPKKVNGYKIVALGSEYTADDLDIMYSQEKINYDNTGSMYSTEVDASNKCIINDSDNTVKTLIIPEGVTCIKPYAFGSMKSLTKLVLPKSLSRISGSNFRDLNIKTIEFKSGVFLDGAFDKSIIGTIIAHGRLYYESESEFTASCKVNKLEFKKGAYKSNNNNLFLEIAMTINKVIIPKDIKSISFEYCDIDNLVLKNPDIKLKQELNGVVSVTYVIDNVKATYNTKTSKYEYELPKIKSPFEEYEREVEKNVVHKDTKITRGKNPQARITYRVRRYCKVDDEWKEYKHSFMEVMHPETH